MQKLIIVKAMPLLMCVGALTACSRAPETYSDVRFIAYAYLSELDIYEQFTKIPLEYITIRVRDSTKTDTSVQYIFDLIPPDTNKLVCTKPKGFYGIVQYKNGTVEPLYGNINLLSKDSFRLAIRLNAAQQTLKAYLDTSQYVQSNSFLQEAAKYVKP